MRSIARLQRTNHATDSASEMPSKKHRDFFRHRTTRQTPSRGSNRGCDSTGWPTLRSPPRACFLVDLGAQSSANKEQRPTGVYIKKKKYNNIISTLILFAC